MSTTKEDIARWFKAGLEGDYDYMIVVCDTFDWEDYPKYCYFDNFTKVYDGTNGRNMQKIMEVYDLSMDMDKQLSEHRANNGPSI
jgi:hypothetical protein